jgi:C4-dicarboxylate-specific signal transduction histidine kinase
MNGLHSLLKRQLRHFADQTIPLIEEQTGFLKAINEAYWQFDADRMLLEHSLELTSQELLERNAELSRTNTELEMRVAARTAELSGSEARFRGLLSMHLYPFGKKISLQYGSISMICVARGWKISLPISTLIRRLFPSVRRG